MIFLFGKFCKNSNRFFKDSGGYEDNVLCKYQGLDRSIEFQPCAMLTCQSMLYTLCFRLPMFNDDCYLATGGRRILFCKSFGMLQSDSCDWKHCRAADGSKAGPLLYETLEIMETITWPIRCWIWAVHSSWYTNGIYMYCKGELYEIANRKCLYSAHLPTLLLGVKSRLNYSQAMSVQRIAVLTRWYRGLRRPFPTKSTISTI